MKKLLVLFFLPFIVNGQITGVKQSEDATEVKIGYCKRSDFDKINLYYLIKKADTTITIDYYNQKYSTLKDLKFIHFKGGAKEVNELYNLLMSFYSEENKDNKDMRLDFNLGKTAVTVSRSKKQIMIWTDAGYFILDKGNINSLFKK